MWRQLIASITGVVLSWSPVPGAQRVSHDQAAPAAITRQAEKPPANPNLRYGREAVMLALEKVTNSLVDLYYEKHGGLFVSRSYIERRVRKEMEERQEEIFQLVQTKFMCDGVPLAFNPETDQVTYSENHCMRTVTVTEIAATVMELQKELKD